MRLQEALSRQGATTIVDITDLDLPDEEFNGFNRTVLSRGELGSVEVDPGTVLLALLGPNAPAHADPDFAATMVDAVQPGAHALLLLGWPVDDLPTEQLLGALDAHGAQIVEPIVLDPAPVDGVQCALLVAPEPPSPREVNGRALAELPARVQWSAASDHGGSGADATGGTDPTGGTEPDPTGDAGDARMPATRYARAALRLPRRMARNVLAPRRPAHRVVPIALPATGRAPGRSELLTITSPSNLLVPRRIAESGLAGYEKSALACFLAACDVAKPGAVLDIGANVGIYAAVGRALTERDVIAFEPWQTLVDIARQFSADNDLAFTVEALALGASNRTATLYLSDAGDSSNSLRRNFRPSSHQVNVPVETLDSFVARTAIVPAVMKVDTEATEPDVLIGAARTIDEHRPWILCEVLARRVERRLHDILAPFGYRWYHVTDAIPLREAARIVGDPTHADLMWLFAPEKPGDEFWSGLRERADALATCTGHRGRQLRAAQRRRSP